MEVERFRGVGRHGHHFSKELDFVAKKFYCNNILLVIRFNIYMYIYICLLFIILNVIKVILIKLYIIIV